MNLTEVLAELQKVTNRNLEILQALNDSFYSKREHITAVIDGTRYNIPSFLYLESKIGDLENNFENLVNAPKTGTAAFVFDGNSQEIQLKSFYNTPDPLTLHETTNFSVEENQIFKDFLSPNPYIRLDLSEIGSDITEVVVKKVDIRSQELLSSIQSVTSDANSVGWPSAAKILYNYKSGVDYIEYDTIRRLPLRSETAEGTYTIKKIDKNWTDSDLVEHYILELGEKLNYWINSGTIQREIAVGDHLITENGKSKLRIIQLDYQKSTVEVVTENGSFADLAEYNAGYSNNSYSILKYFSEVGQDQSKHIDIPLEEDQNLMVFVAALESGMNIQGPWGTGILVDTSRLTIEENGTIYTFPDYYKEKINNIGDTLYGLTRMFSTDLFNMGSEDFNAIVESKPELNPELLQVIEINSHLNDSESVQKIRSLHNQKSAYKSELATVQSDIDRLTELLSELSFSDTSNNRVVYEEQLVNLNGRKAELNKNISEITDEIANNVNSADVPIENAKYHIRGFYDVSEIEQTTGKKVIKIDVEYRYKNRNKQTGTATSFSVGDSEDSKTYIYSDWNKMPSQVVLKVPGLIPMSQTVEVNYPESTDEKNIPSFNQIDIPITQGETVDIRLRVQFSDGYPFIEMFSDWSPILNVGFPEEFVASVPLMRIIETNNEDAEQYRFRNILDTEGVLRHVADRIYDQDLEYFHQPEHIASGFYTDERRVIPLKDKLSQMDSDIHSVLDEIYGLDPSNLDVTVSDTNYTVNLVPYSTGTFIVPSYKDTSSNQDLEHNAVDILTITVANNGTHDIKLFPMFPGNSGENITGVTKSKFAIEDYFSDGGALSRDISVFGYTDNHDDLTGQIDAAMGDQNLFSQHQNQLVYFRLNNPYNGVLYYRSSSDIPDLIGRDDILCGNYDRTLIRKMDSSFGASLIPMVSGLSNISVAGGSRFYVLRPGDYLSIPLEFRYNLGDGSESDHIQKTISFDLWTTLFGDPVNYTLCVRANYIDDISTKNRTQPESKYTPNIVE